jgi:hypothetical protein
VFGNVESYRFFEIRDMNDSMSNHGHDAFSDVDRRDQMARPAKGTNLAAMLLRSLYRI